VDFVVDGRGRRASECHGRCAHGVGDWTTVASAADAITDAAAPVTQTAAPYEAITVFVATDACHIHGDAPGAQTPIGVVLDSDLVAFMAR
jgi:hypothetical protein